MKRFKKLGVLLGILVVVCIATFALTHYEEEQEQIKNSDEIILQIPADTVISLSWEYAEEGNLAFHKGEDGWLYDEDEYFPVSEEKVNDILSEFEAFGVTFIIENVTDYSQYGLDEPEMTFHIGTEETSYDIKLGAFSTMDQQRYIDISDGNVYLVSEDPMDYVSASLSDMILDDDTPGFENVVDIRFEGTENYMIQRLEDTNYSYSDDDVYFTQKNGEYLPLDKSAVTQYLNTITSLDLLTYVTYNATEEELTEYGLDEPELTVTVNYTQMDQASEDQEQIPGTCVIHISRNPEELAAAEEAEAKGENAEAVSMYVRVGDSQIVYDLDSVDYGILSDASYDDLRHQEVFWADFADVTQIDITLEDTEHTLISELDDDEERVWYYQTEEILAEATEETTEDAEETTETEAIEEPETLDLTDFEDSLNALSANSFTAEIPTEKEEIRFTLHLDNESFPTVEIVLYRYSGTECLAVVDGESVSLVPRASVMELVEAVQTIVLSQA
ncbi:MAG: DUF4340 domain-containing protein [Oscillospiraceae bacterium]|nr:DUF4340 domain-containing protein [Oscillospiraceae bacterium]